MLASHGETWRPGGRGCGGSKIPEIQVSLSAGVPFNLQVSVEVRLSLPSLAAGGRFHI